MFVVAVSLHVYHSSGGVAGKAGVAPTMMSVVWSLNPRLAVRV